jgi:hypothetical protein
MKVQAGIKIIFSLLIFIILAGCNEKEKTSQNANTVSFEESLFDVNFPRMYMQKDDMAKYLAMIGHSEWLKNDSTNQNYHFYPSEVRSDLVLEKHINALSISDTQGEYFPRITLETAIRIAENFLPGITPPGNGKKPDYQRKAITTWTRTLENIYFIPEEPYLGTNSKIIYTAKFLSDVKQPNSLNGREGGTPYYTAIGIYIENNTIQEIVIGGMQYSPPRLQRTFLLETSIINDYNALCSILTSGESSEAFIAYKK